MTTNPSGRPGIFDSDGRFHPTGDTLSERNDAFVVSDHVRQLANQLGVELADVECTGAGGRVTATDVRAAAGQGTPTGRGETLTERPSAAARELADRNAKVLTTPLVRSLANEAGVELANIVGTGVGGRISAADVRGVAQNNARLGIRPSGAAAPAKTADAWLQPAAGLGARPKLMQQRQSEWGINVFVQVDAFAANPLLDDFRQSAPQSYEIAMKNNPNPPTLFEVGDRPMFCASGIDPAMLDRLPWCVRHAAAASDDPKQIAYIFEVCGGGSARAAAAAEALVYSDQAYRTGGLSAYRNRFNDWADGVAEPSDNSPQYLKASDLTDIDFSNWKF